MAISQMFRRSAPGRQAACSALIPRSAPRKLGPCHACFSYASSRMLSSSSISALIGDYFINVLALRARL